MKISFTTCFMNREDHLRSVIQHNLTVISKYDFEYVILDYSSKSNSYITELAKNDKLSCYRVDGYKFYHHSHAKNVATKLTTGDLIIHVDADNLISSDFLENVHYLMDDNLEDYVINADNSADMYGRICISRNNFMKLSGYDEHFIGWGFEDTDFIQRAGALLGLKYIVVDEQMRPISHTDKERVKFTKFRDHNKIHMNANANATIMKYNLENCIMAPNECFGECTNLIKL